MPPKKGKAVLPQTADPAALTKKGAGQQAKRRAVTDANRVWTVLKIHDYKYLSRASRAFLDFYGKTWTGERWEIEWGDRTRSWWPWDTVASTGDEALMAEARGVKAAKLNDPNAARPPAEKPQAPQAPQAPPEKPPPKPRGRPPKNGTSAKPVKKRLEIPAGRSASIYLEKDKHGNNIEEQKLLKELNMSSSGLL